MVIENKRDWTQWNYARWTSSNYKIQSLTNSIAHANQWMKTAYGTSSYEQQTMIQLYKQI